MLVSAIIVSALALIALLRFGLVIEYSDAGFELWLKIAFLKLRLMDKDKKEKPKKIRKKKEKEKEKKPGSLQAFMDMLKAVMKALARLKHRLLIKRLTLYYTSAGSDPASTAIRYGTVNAVFGLIIPVLERNFRIKRSDLRASVDFTSSEQKIYAKIAISIAVWEIIYILAALLPILAAGGKSRNDRNITGKVSTKNGEKTDMRLDGNNNAESKGDDCR